MSAAPDSYEPTLFCDRCNGMGVETTDGNGHDCPRCKGAGTFRWSDVPDTQRPLSLWSDDSLPSVPVGMVMGFDPAQGHARGPFPADQFDAKGKRTTSGRRNERCRRCGGAGGWKGWPGFTCYDCGGAGVVARDFTEVCYTAERLVQIRRSNAKAEATRQAKRNAEAERQRELRDAARRDMLLAHRDLFDRMEARKAQSNFVADVLSKSMTLGHITSAQITAVGSALDRMDERDALKAGEAASVFVGEVGKRQDFGRCVVTYRSPGYKSEFGYFYVVTFATGEGNVLVYKGGKPPEGGPGTLYWITATPKTHETYNDVKQTQIARPKFTSTP